MNSAVRDSWVRDRDGCAYQMFDIQMNVIQNDNTVFDFLSSVVKSSKAIGYCQRNRNTNAVS